MVSETAVPICDDVNAAQSTVSGKKNRGKIPRKIVKAEREKSKRDHLNLLFIELEKVIEPDQQNNGKASMLNSTIRLLGELFTQIDGLKKENASLLSETHDVTIEKNELKEENSALETQIEKLQNEIEERVQSQSSWTSSLPELQPTAQTSPANHLRLQTHHASSSPPVVSPVIVLPLNHDQQAYVRPDTTEFLPKVQSNVSRPHPRYPSQSDSWPTHILARHVNPSESNKQSCTD